MSNDSGPKLPDLVLSRDDVRAIDAAAIQSLGIPGLLLMENAARGVNDLLQREDTNGQVVIVCGPGNTGGDGLAIARQRAAAGLSSRVILETAGKKLTADAQSNLDFLQRSGVPVNICDADPAAVAALSNLTADDWIVESLLGTGVRSG